MNDLFRKDISSRINKAITDAKDAGDLEHPSLTGKLREMVLQKLIEPMLNERYSVSYGKIVDYKGILSKEMDLCIYSRMIHPPLFFLDKKDFGVFPIESVLACIEVKSKLDRSNLKDAFDKFNYIEDNLTMTHGYHDEYDNPLNHAYIKHRYNLFSFNQGPEYTAESLLEMYSTIDSAWNSDPLISNICLANKGWICFTRKGWLHMPYSVRAKINEEIIGFLCTLVQDLPRVEASRGIPRIGYYLTDPSTTGRFENGKLLEKPWNREGPLPIFNTKIDKMI